MWHRRYLNYKNCKCRSKLVDKLVEECSDNIDGNEMIYNGNLNGYEKVCNSCRLYMVLFVIREILLPLLGKVNDYVAHI